MSGWRLMFTSMLIDMKLFFCALLYKNHDYKLAEISPFTASANFNFIVTFETDETLLLHLSIRRENPFQNATSGKNPPLQGRPLRWFRRVRQLYYPP